MPDAENEAKSGGRFPPCVWDSRDFNPSTEQGGWCRATPVYEDPATSSRVLSLHRPGFKQLLEEAGVGD
ncbi:hypothetical protein ACWD5D_35875, partial [Streptomyces sp. NPDC002520]